MECGFLTSLVSHEASADTRLRSASYDGQAVPPLGHLALLRQESSGNQVFKKLGFIGKWQKSPKKA